MSKLLPTVLVAACGLLHCGPTLPVKAAVVNCTTKQPIADAQFDRMGNISRTGADGTWQTTTIGNGGFPVDVFKEGYKKDKFKLEPGDKVNNICLMPDGT
ncbi:MAG: hypothetical protein EOP08_15700 [Proteobacteria bacterium]|nr:MAG: hypothetical protein EOP08_15700 [Pseudomonadota bacterium]